MNMLLFYSQDDGTCSLADPLLKHNFCEFYSALTQHRSYSAKDAFKRANCVQNDSWMKLKWIWHESELPTCWWMKWSLSTTLYYMRMSLLPRLQLRYAQQAGNHTEKLEVLFPFTVKWENVPISFHTALPGCLTMTHGWSLYSECMW